MDVALDKAYIGGAFSVADAALPCVECWAAAHLTTSLPANFGAHFVRMKGRPAVAGMIAEEGLAA